jgi:hypothetical protein
MHAKLLGSIAVHLREPEVLHTFNLNSDSSHFID